MWHVTSENLRQIQVTTASIASCNTFLIVASFGFGMGNNSWVTSDLLMLPQVLVNLYALFFCYFKHYFAHKVILQLVASMALAAVYIFFAARIFPLVINDSGQFLLKIVEGANVLIALLIMIESALSTVVIGRDKTLGLSAGGAGASITSATPVSEVQVPQQVHIYQPRLSLTPGQPRRSSVLSGAASSAAGVAQSSNDEGYRVDILALEEEDEEIENSGNEGVELEVLPKYQRRRPAQSATIIDLGNIQGVDPAVLSSVLGESTQQSEQQAQEGGVEGLDVAEAPAYSQTVPAAIAVAVSSSTGSESPTAAPSRPASTSSPVPATLSAPIPAPTSEPPVYMP